MLLRKEERVHEEEEGPESLQRRRPARGETERGRTGVDGCEIDATLKKIPETGRVCLVITVKTCVTNYRVQLANEHRLPDHAPYSITGERETRRAPAGERRGRNRGSFSPLMTFRLMRPRRAGYFLNLAGRHPPPSSQRCFFSPGSDLRSRWGRRRKPGEE